MDETIIKFVEENEGEVADPAKFNFYQVSLDKWGMQTFFDHAEQSVPNYGFYLCSSGAACSHLPGMYDREKTANHYHGWIAVEWQKDYRESLSLYECFAEEFEDKHRTTPFKKLMKPKAWFRTFMADKEAKGYEEIRGKMSKAVHRLIQTQIAVSKCLKEGNYDNLKMHLFELDIEDEAYEELKKNKKSAFIPNKRKRLEDLPVDEKAFKKPKHIY
jgi:hypothetical protein